MTDLEHILPLWRELESAGAEYVLATIVAVEGSSYRRPGAHMLIARDGRRAGTVSGGCLEAEVAKRAWWLTERGPVVERYSTLEDDGDLPYGSGCGGVVYILLERRATAQPLLRQLETAFHARSSFAVATVLEGPHMGWRAYAGTAEAEAADLRVKSTALLQAARTALATRSSADGKLPIEGTPTRVWADYRAPRPGLWVFGAGDDAKPLVAMARQLGWFVSVADGRAHLATRVRFKHADEVHPLTIADLPDAPPNCDLRAGDGAVVMTHSFEQDMRVLAWLLGPNGELPIAYVGVLGPQRRTREAIAHAARLHGQSLSSDEVESRLERLHAPMGLDLGGDTSPSVALSILSEIQRCVHGLSARPLREVRATSAPQTV
ncbi:MAG: XdhC family protein [Acidobacteriota bacterium]